MLTAGRRAGCSAGCSAPTGCCGARPPSTTWPGCAPACRWPCGSRRPPPSWIPDARAGYVARLDEGNRLTALESAATGRRGPRSAFDLSYRAEPAPARRLFRLLGLLPGRDVTVAAAPALAGRRARGRGRGGTAPAPAGRAPTWWNTRLRAASPCTTCCGCTPATAPPARTGRTGAAPRPRRLLDWYRRTVDAAVLGAYPEKIRLPPDEPPAAGLPRPPTSALTWLDAERANLIAAIEHAAEHGPHPVAWRLADALRGYFWTSAHRQEWSDLGAAALAAAEAEGDARAVAVARINLGDLCLRSHRHDRAVEHYERAVAHLRHADWPEAEGVVFGKLGLVHRESGNTTRALRCYRRALALASRTGDPVREATALGNLGFVQYESGAYRQAAAGHAQALARYRELGIASGEAAASGNLRGRPARAGAVRGSAVPVRRGAADPARDRGHRYGSGHPARHGRRRLGHRAPGPRGRSRPRGSRTRAPRR